LTKQALERKIPLMKNIKLIFAIPRLGVQKIEEGKIAFELSIF